MSPDGGRLLVAPHWLGDFVMATALVAAWRARDPGRPVGLLVLPDLAPLARAVPGVDRVHVLPFARGAWAAGARLRLGRRLRGLYSEAVVVPRSWKAALVPWAAGVPRRTGYAGGARWPLVNDPRPLPPGWRRRPYAERLALLAPPGTATLPAPRLDARPARGEAVLRAHGGTEGPWVALAPGAEYGPAKRWPVGSYAALARALRARGWRTLVLGTAAERPLGEALARAGSLDLTGRTRLEEVPDILAATRAFVGNDSGLLHVARAVGVPAVGIFGSSDPVATAPEGTRVVTRGVPCSPCFERRCRYGHTMCLRDIPPEAVIGALGLPACADAGAWN